MVFIATCFTLQHCTVKNTKQPVFLEKNPGKFLLTIAIKESRVVFIFIVHVITQLIFFRPILNLLA